MSRLDDLARARFAAVALLEFDAVTAALAAWSLLDFYNAQTTFERDVLPGLVAAMLDAQSAAAEVGSLYANKAAQAQGIPAGPPVIASALTGVTSSGGDLIDLLSRPLLRTYQAAAVGAPPGLALAAGKTLLDGIVSTQVQDTARAAELTSLAANAEVAGYIRIVEPKACSRCILLAGKFYKWNAGFKRHPRCRCHHELRHEEIEPQDPMEIFNGLPREEQDRVFTAAGAQAIRDGADIYQVVNVRMGMQTATVAGQNIKTSTIGTGSRSYTVAVRRAIAQARGEKIGRQQPRLMPEEIVRQANGNRAMVRKLLISNGYIVGDIAALAREVATP